MEALTTEWIKIATILTSVGAGIAIIVSYLDSRARKIKLEIDDQHRDEFDQLKKEVANLQLRVTTLENGQREAREILIQAILADNRDEIIVLIRRAMGSLH